ncbi:MAG: transposase, partial [Planctomycetes bacterium]|nr:transposase [Planctomycetota bacterium]
ADWLQEPSQSELARAFVAWLGEILLPSRMPEVPLPRLSNFQEARTLLAERVKEWTRQWREEGLRKGREEGQAELLMRQIESKFGPLSDEVRQRIATADSDRRLLWAERVLTAERLEDIFE